MLYGPAIRDGDAVSERRRRGWATSRLGCGLALALVALDADARDARAPSLPVPAETRDRFDTVVIDPGHGGEDQGAVGASGLREKDLVLEIGQRLAALLRERGLRVVLTRESDRAVGLAERATRANASAGDLFLSLHANAAPSRSARGVETFFASLEASDAIAQSVAHRENAAFGGVAAAPAGEDGGLSALLGDLVSAEHLEESDQFARLAHERLAPLDEGGSRGVKQAPFAVLLHARMPAALIEVGFVTNAAEERALASESRQNAIARALADAVAELGRRHDARRGLQNPSVTKEDAR